MLFTQKATETSAGKARRPREARRPAANIRDLKPVLLGGADLCRCDEFIECEKGNSHAKADGLLEKWPGLIREVCHGVQQSVEANMSGLCALTSMSRVCGQVAGIELLH